MKIGNTPLVDVSMLGGLEAPCRVYAKLEGMNVTGSMKIRSAERIVREAKLFAGETLVESTSGNMGVALAAIAQQRGVRCVLVVDPKLSPYHRKEMLRYGAELVEVTEVDDTGGWLKTRLAKVEYLLWKNRTWFWTDQYNSPANPRAFVEMGNEMLLKAFGLVGPDLYKRIWLFMAVSTGGSLSGTASVFKKLVEKGIEVRVVAVDAEGSAIFGGPIKKRYLNGIGSSLENPGNLRRELIDEICIINDETAFAMCHRLRRVGLSVGGSSGAVMAAVVRNQHRFTPFDIVFTVLPDEGIIYDETIYSEKWLSERGFNLHEVVAAK